MTKLPGTFEDIVKGGGRNSNGYGIIREQITVAEDGPLSGLLRLRVTAVTAARLGRVRRAISLPMF